MDSKQKRSLTSRFLLCIFITLMLRFPPNTYQSGIDQSDGTGFTVQIRDEVIPFSVMGLYVLPDEQIPINIRHENHMDVFRIKSSAGTLKRTDSNRWIWQAPTRTGIYPIQIIETQSQRSVTLNVFVMIPIDCVQDGQINGYKVGDYPQEPYRGLPEYMPPSGLIEVNEKIADTWISPHFQLKQFVCKDAEGYPKYLALQESLIIKLESILMSLRDDGYGCETLTIMSGFRTPEYNRSIGNGRYSRHVYGAAADIYIDSFPKDGQMDDLNLDGRVDFHDAKVLFDHIDKLSIRSEFSGGLGFYEATAAHGPFVHVDVRGYPARWSAVPEVVSGM